MKKEDVFCEKAGQVIFNLTNWIKIVSKMIPDDCIIGKNVKCSKKDAIDGLNNALEQLRTICRELNPEWYNIIDNIKQTTNY